MSRELRCAKPGCRNAVGDNPEKGRRPNKYCKRCYLDWRARTADREEHREEYRKEVPKVPCPICGQANCYVRGGERRKACFKCLEVGVCTKDGCVGPVGRHPDGTKMPRCRVCQEAWETGPHKCQTCDEVVKPNALGVVHKLCSTCHRGRARAGAGICTDCGVQLTTDGYAKCGVCHLASVPCKHDTKKFGCLNRDCPFKHESKASKALREEAAVAHTKVRASEYRSRGQKLGPSPGTAPGGVLKGKKAT